jgi:hypothetical protein
MAIADPKYFTREHVESCRFGVSSELAEQALHCLELAAQLSTAGLSFQFKGGNSLLVILDHPQRFSIDVDIATDEPREAIERCLDRIVAEYGVFTRWHRRQHKTKPWLPVASYYLHYRSVYGTDDEQSVMLDVQLRRSPYKTERKALVSGRLYRCDVEVELPLASSVIGDKLLTVGPFTLGIPLGKGKEAQRLKHIYDVSVLLATRPNLDEIRDSFDACLGHENDLQEKTVGAQEIMKDTVAFCGSTALSDMEPELSDGLPPQLRESAVGFLPFTGHLLTDDYSWQRLQSDMARVALCIVAVCLPAVPHELFDAALNGQLPSPSNGYLSREAFGANRAARSLWEHVGSWLECDPLAVTHLRP